jgi:hypothetical protein
MGHLLPRKAVHEHTWSAIMAHLRAPGSPTAPVAP